MLGLGVLRHQKLAIRLVSLTPESRCCAQSQLYFEVPFGGATPGFLSRVKKARAGIQISYEIGSGVIAKGILDGLLNVEIQTKDFSQPEMLCSRDMLPIIDGVLFPPNLNRSIIKDLVVGIWSLEITSRLFFLASQSRQYTILVHCCAVQVPCMIKGLAAD